MFTNSTTHKTMKAYSNVCICSQHTIEYSGHKDQQSKNWAILDSGATRHLLVTDAPVTQLQFTEAALKVRLPEGKQVRSTHTCLLNLTQLPTAAQKAYIIP